MPMSQIRAKSQAALVPHSGQNLAPLSSAPQLLHTAGARSILVPQLGQNLAPLVSVPHLGQASAAGCTIGEPHSGQNLVPGAASVPSLGQRAMAEEAALAALAAWPTSRITSPKPKALANPFTTPAACSAWA